MRDSGKEMGNSLRCHAVTGITSGGKKGHWRYMAQPGLEGLEVSIENQVKMGEGDAQVKK